MRRLRRPSSITMEAAIWPLPSTSFQERPAAELQAWQGCCGGDFKRAPAGGGGQTRAPRGGVLEPGPPRVHGVPEGLAQCVGDGDQLRHVSRIRWLIENSTLTRIPGAS